MIYPMTLFESQIETNVQKCHLGSTAVKVKLFTAYVSNVYMCTFCVNYIEKQRFGNLQSHTTIAIDRILNRHPMRFSASHMLATDNVN